MFGEYCSQENMLCSPNEALMTYSHLRTRHSTGMEPYKDKTPLQLE